ncbi:zinc-ribbon domain-containing protein [Rhodococcus sp. BP-332]|uniref:zinc-ribbon domain-containing protein n=1 Tax=Rhodococcus sp. BP-332 TaxID=2739447 RepID=UPI001C9B206F|nr:zinc-ribbon domain-containing protein [Rhodococcus sp. BP-332]MBY6676560.1 zinc-ribbon domain-containing protein [Rhodococcus sp. BP-332]
MFLLFGFGLKRRSLGAGHTRTCQRCHNTTQWARMQQYKQFSVFFIPLARWNRTEFEECGICGAAVYA